MSFPSQPQTWNECPVCSVSSAAEFVTFEDLGFVRCTACPTVYKRFERPTLRAADFYEASYFHGRKSGRDRRFEHRVRKGMRQIRGAMAFGQVRSVLDVGCSFGYLIEAGRRLGLASAGTDISQYAVENCRQRGLRAEVGTLEALPFSDGEFDLIILRHVLEHTPSPRAALAEVRRVLSPTGIILVAVPDVDYWKGNLLRRTYRYYRPDDLGQQHYVYYSQGSLTALLESEGFRVRAATKAFVRPDATSSGALSRVAEYSRFAALGLWQGLGRALRLRRELYMIAARTGAGPTPRSP